MCDAEAQKGPDMNEPSKIKNSVRREPEEHDENEETLDKTIADSFPASDPPSSIPDPEEDAA